MNIGSAALACGSRSDQLAANFVAHGTALGPAADTRHDGGQRVAQEGIRR
jgi:hypothetical protein